ncbi:MAG: glycosyltransferase family 4 protein [Chloroflexota bacterium]|nr:glycosyltransferase family 4 protein [Chloroflexota bacterium]
MRIGIDYRNAVAPSSGVGVYTEQLVKHLLSQYPQLRLFLFVDKPVKDIFPDQANVQIVFVPASHRIAWEQVALPLAANKLHLDILHRPSDVGGTLVPLSMHYVVTVHDLIPLMMRNIYLRNPFHRLYYYLKLCQTRVQAAHILTVSNQSKLDLIQRLGFSATAITTTLNALPSTNNRGKTAKFTSLSQREFQLQPKQYILGLGGSEYRKNNLRLAEAFLQIRDQLSMPYQLAIVGGRWRNTTDLDEYIRQYHAQADILLLDQVTTAELQHLYEQAAVFVFPSLYEGFGIPALEAMAHSTPTIVSNRGALPEVVDQAALLVDPSNTAELASAIMEVLQNRDLQATLATRGLENVKRFSYARTAEQTFKVYQALCNNQQPLQSFN